MFKLALFLCSKFEFEQHEQAGKTANHTYTAAGAYAVTLTVKDAAGKIATHQITVTVETAKAEALPTMWIASAVIVTIFIVVFAVMFLRRKRKKRCPNCGAKLPADSKGCRKC